MTELEEFKAALQKAFTMAVAAANERIPQTSAGFQLLLHYSEPWPPNGWEKRWQVTYAEPTRAQLAARILPLPDVVERGTARHSCNGRGYHESCMVRTLFTCLFCNGDGGVVLEPDAEAEAEAAGRMIEGVLKEGTT